MAKTKAKTKTIVQYRDRKTGRYVGRATWKRSKVKGGTRYRRKSRPLKKRREIAPPPRLPENRVYIVVIDYKPPKGKKRKHDRIFADLVIVAPRDATPTEIADQAREQLPAKHAFLANFIEGGFSEITIGETTNDRASTETREFKRK